MPSRSVSTQVTRNPAAMMASSQPSEPSHEIDAAGTSMVIAPFSLGWPPRRRLRPREPTVAGTSMPPRVGQASGGPLGGRGPLLGHCLLVSDGLADPAEPEQVVHCQADTPADQREEEPQEPGRDGEVEDDQPGDDHDVDNRVDGKAAPGALQFQ